MGFAHSNDFSVKSLTLNLGPDKYAVARCLKNNKASMLVFGKDHFIKFCIRTSSWQKNGECNSSPMTLRIMIFS